MNSKQLFAKRAELVAKMKECVANGMTDDALRIEGQISALDEQIQAVLDEEEEARNAAVSARASQPEASFAEQVFGARDTFEGIPEGFRGKGSLRAAVSGLPTPQIYRRDLKAPISAPAGFLDTLPKGTTDGDEHFFKTPTLTNNAAGWVTGQTANSGSKPESSIAWAEGVAHIETIAHWIPILKQTARRYSQLESIVSGALMLGLDLKCNEYALRGSNTSGIVGVCNTSGILSHTKQTGKNLRDTFMSMKRKVRVASGMAAGYVCLSPYALESLYQEKDEEGRYLYDDLEKSGTIRGLVPVEDVNMTVTETTGSGDTAKTTVKEQALVYWNGGATFDIADPEEVTIGLTGNQFIQNAYTMLAELTAALRVDTPAAFCLCEDLGITAEA